LILKLPDNLETIETLIYESVAVGQIKMVLKAELPILTLEAYASGQMVTVEKGPFLYGDKKAKNESLNYDYEIDLFPVTNAAYCKFLNDKKPNEDILNKWINLNDSYKNERCRIKKDSNSYIVEKSYEEHPVIFVSWYGADEYAKSIEKRLPTEEEWEKAARGPEGWKYPWGDKFDPSWRRSKLNL
jgi:formylglycine-generating enzyme required for sulfatase activity